jgi:hypothetical protein
MCDMTSHHIAEAPSVTWSTMWLGCRPGGGATRAKFGFHKFGDFGSDFGQSYIGWRCGSSSWHCIAVHALMLYCFNVSWYSWSGACSTSTGLVMKLVANSQQSVISLHEHRHESLDLVNGFFLLDRTKLSVEVDIVYR